MRETYDKQIEELKGSVVRVEFRVEEIGVAQTTQETKDIRDLKERLTAFETDLTYWNLKEYHQPKQIYVIDETNIKNILEEAPEGTNFITRVLNAQQPTALQAESLHIPPEDPKEYLSSCNPQDLNVLKRPSSHSSNHALAVDLPPPPIANENQRYRPCLSKVLRDHVKETEGDEEESKEISLTDLHADVLNNKCPRKKAAISQNNLKEYGAWTRAGGGGAGGNLDESLLKALDLTANFPM